MTLPNTYLVKHRLEPDASIYPVRCLNLEMDNKAMPYDPHRLAVAQRLAIAMKEADINQTVLSDACGCSVSAVGEWLKTGRIHEDRFPYISKTVNRSVLWLRIGLEPESIAMAEVHESLPKDSKVAFQKVGYSLAQSSQLIPWDEKRDPDQDRQTFRTKCSTRQNAVSWMSAYMPSSISVLPDVHRGRRSHGAQVQAQAKATDKARSSVPMKRCIETSRFRRR